MKKALITGGTGFVGQRLVKRLNERDIYCRVLVHTRQPPELGKFDRSLVEFVEADTTIFESLAGLAEGVDTVYNLAAVGHVSASSQDAYREFHRVNVKGVENLARACAGHPLKRFVHFSSTAAVGLIHAPLIDEQTQPQPRTPYQHSKRQGELILAQVSDETGLPAVILRPCMIYGPGGEGEFLTFCRLISKGLFPRPGLGHTLVPIVYVDDVVSAAISAGERGRPGEIYFVASEHSLRMAAIHRLVTKTLGTWRPYWYAPIWILLAGAFFIETYAKLRNSTPIVTRANIRSTAASRVFSIAKAQRELGYAPQMPWGKGIPLTVNWYRAQGLL